MKFTVKPDEVNVIIGEAIIKVQSGGLWIFNHLFTAQNTPIRVETLKYSSNLVLEPDVRSPETVFELESVEDCEEDTYIIVSLKSAIDSETSFYSFPPSWSRFASRLSHDICEPQAKNKEKGEKGVDNHMPPPSVLVTGSRNVGKSTFCRFLVNGLFNRIGGNRRILLLELDIGQPEFTPSGIMSLFEISGPLLGHKIENLPIRPIAQTYLASNSIKEYPQEYFSATICMLECVKRYHDDAEAPPVLIINTPGWIKGLGLEYLKSLMNPMITHTVFIDSQPQIDQHNARVGEFFQSLLEGSQVFPTPPRQSLSGLVFDCLDPNPIKAGTLRMSSVDIRAFKFSRYFSNSATRSIKVSLPKFLIQILGAADVHPSKVLAVLNGSLVSLCKMIITSSQKKSKEGESIRIVQSQFPVCNQWLGLAVIAHIDMKALTAILITPCSDDLIQKDCNLLMKSSHHALDLSTLKNIQSPHSILTSDHPYISESIEGLSLGPSTKRFRGNLMRRSNTQTL